jgi:hypothetical protein
MAGKRGLLDSGDQGSVGYYGSDGKTQSSTSSLAGAVVLIAVGRPRLSTPYAAPLALPQKQVERPARCSRLELSNNLLQIGDIVAVDVDRHDLPAVLLARAFQRRGEPTRTCERIEEAGSSFPPNGPKPGAERVSERAPGLMLTNWTLERIRRRIKI